MIVMDFPGASLMAIRRADSAVTIQCPGCGATYAYEMREPPAGPVLFEHAKKRCPVLRKIRSAERFRQAHPDDPRSQRVGVKAF